MGRLDISADTKVISMAINKVIYSGHTFTNAPGAENQIKTGPMLRLSSALLSDVLSINTCEFTVESNDTSLTSFVRNTPLEVFSDDVPYGIYYVQTVTRSGPNIYQFYATSTIGLLAEGLHYGDIYTGQTVEEVLPGIMGTVPYYIKSNLKPIKLYGWLPVAAPRDNLSQVLFAIGATVKTDLDGYLRIESFWDSVSSITGKDRIYSGAKVGYTPAVTQVVVTEHQYVESAESMQLFEGTTAAGDIVTFNEPMHDLTASGFTVLDSGANWARLSAGPGTLTGLKYTHNTRQIAKDVAEAQVPNIKKVENATLISLVNSQATAERLANYYKWLETVDAAVVYKGEKPGDRLEIYHPYNNSETTGCLQSADVTLSNTLKGQEKVLVGYVPPTAEDVVTYDNRVILTGSGTYEMPEGVANARIVLIGGGDGGTGGTDGEDGESGKSVDAYTYISEFKYGAGGKGGQGGAGGAAGASGLVYISDIRLDGTRTVRYDCGQGGIGGSNGERGTRGTKTTLQIGETVYSSEDGGSSGVGYTDPQTGDTYAAPGENGENGADGGDGSTFSGRSYPDYKFNGENGGDINDALGAWGYTAEIQFDRRLYREQGGQVGTIIYTERIIAGQSIDVSLPFTLSGGTGYTFDERRGESGCGLYTVTGETKVTITPDSFAFSEAGQIPIDNIHVAVAADNNTAPGMLVFKSATLLDNNKATLTFDYYCSSWKSSLSGNADQINFMCIISGSGGGGAAKGTPAGRPYYSSNGSDGPTVGESPKYGNGGHGGNGGGGGGGGGGGAILTSGKRNVGIQTASGAKGGAGGHGSPGGTGGPGCIILYYGIPHVTSSGWLKTRDGKYFNGRLKRRFIV